MEDALHLYALREWRMLWEVGVCQLRMSTAGGQFLPAHVPLAHELVSVSQKEFDTKCFVAWNDERVSVEHGARQQARKQHNRMLKPGGMQHLTAACAPLALGPHRCR